MTKDALVAIEDSTLHGGVTENIRDTSKARFGPLGPNTVLHHYSFSQKVTIDPDGLGVDDSADVVGVKNRRLKNRQEFSRITAKHCKIQEHTTGGMTEGGSSKLNSGQ
ncbi:hypothetical protein TNCV_4350501 [Trichonephila clavipes]|nr:hypothetical protein TNCV_4350501 [Trichonephila clavipes]